MEGGVEVVADTIEQGGAVLEIIEDDKVDRYPKEPGDDERFAHYVLRRKLGDAIFDGGAVQALCGKVWVPTRDPKRFPVCPECKDLFDGMPPGDDSDGAPDEPAL